MTERSVPGSAGAEDVPAEVWLQAGDTLAGFALSEGFNCTSFRIERPGGWLPILAEPPSWEALRTRPAFYGSPLLAPYVYGLREGNLEYRGQSYALQPGKERRANHGVTRDYAWIATDMHQGDDEALLRAHLAIGAGDPASDARLSEFPFPLDIDVTYVLRPRELVTRFVVTNLGSDSLPLGVGIHPYFPLPMRTAGTTADLVARGQMARLTDGDRFLANAVLGGHDERPDLFAQRVDRYVALAPTDRAILDLFERTDQPSPVEGEGAPLWSLDDEPGLLTVAIRASADFRFVGQFIPPSRLVLSPVVSTNRPDGLNISAQGGDGGVIELAAGESWRGWCTLSVNDLTG